MLEAETAVEDLCLIENGFFFFLERDLVRAWSFFPRKYFDYIPDFRGGDGLGVWGVRLV